MKPYQYSIKYYIWHIIGAFVNAWDKSNTATPLSCAAACGSLATVEILLAHKADVNAGITKTKTPLHWSVQCDSESCVQKLLTAGAIQNSFHVELGTPLHLAATLSHEKSMRVLLQHGADLGLRKVRTQMICCLNQILKQETWSESINGVFNIVRYTIFDVPEFLRLELEAHRTNAMAFDPFILRDVFRELAYGLHYTALQKRVL